MRGTGQRNGSCPTWTGRRPARSQPGRRDRCKGLKLAEASPSKDVPHPSFGQPGALREFRGVEDRLTVASVHRALHGRTEASATLMKFVGLKATGDTLLFKPARPRQGVRIPGSWKRPSGATYPASSSSVNVVRNGDAAMRSPSPNRRPWASPHKKASRIHACLLPRREYPYQSSFPALADGRGTRRRSRCHSQYSCHSREEWLG